MISSIPGTSHEANHASSLSFITVGKLGYPLRVDMLLYTYSFTSDTLIKVTKNVAALAVVVSSVEMKDLDDETIGATVQYCYGSAPDEVQQKIIEKLHEIRDRIPGRRRPNALTDLGSDSPGVDETEVKTAFEEIMRSEEGLGGSA